MARGQVGGGARAQHACHAAKAADSPPVNPRSSGGSTFCLIGPWAGPRVEPATSSVEKKLLTGSAVLRCPLVASDQAGRAAERLCSGYGRCQRPWRPMIYRRQEHVADLVKLGGRYWD